MAPSPGWQPSQNTIWLMQSIGYFLQVVNAGLSGVTHDPTVTLLVSAGIGAYQMYVQHLGNQSVSPKQAEAMRLINETAKQQ